MKNKRPVLFVLLAILIVLVLLDRKSTKSPLKESGFTGNFTGKNVTLAAQRHQEAWERKCRGDERNQELDAKRQELREQLQKIPAYAKATSPRGQIQQQLATLLRQEGLSNVNLGIGNERKYKNSLNLMQVDFPVNGTLASSEYPRLLRFFQELESSYPQAQWNSCQISSMTGSDNSMQLRISGSLSVFIVSTSARQTAGIP